MNEWQPIETAPRAKRVLVYNSDDWTWGGNKILIGRNNEWGEDWKISFCDLGDLNYLKMIDPIYWMPLPEPPSEVKNELR